MPAIPLDELDLRGLIQDTLTDLGERLDGGLLPALYKAASVSTGTIRAELRAAGLPYSDPATGQVPEAHALDQAAHRLIRDASRLAALRGAAGALGGLTTLAPETAAGLVQGLRLAQRLAVIYGHDPESDRGRLLLTRALSRAWQVELPTGGHVSTHLRQLPDVVRSRLSGPGPGTGEVARTVAVKVITTAGTRLGRIVPGLGTTLGAISARRELRAQGHAMQAVFQRAWEGDLQVEGDVLDVQEVR